MYVVTVCVTVDADIGVGTVECVVATNSGCRYILLRSLLFLAVQSFDLNGENVMSRAVTGIEVSDSGEGIVLLDDGKGHAGHTFSEDTLSHDGYVKFVGVEGCDAPAGSDVAA